jgi:hypothetical protein
MMPNDKKNARNIMPPTKRISGRVPIRILIISLFE